MTIDSLTRQISKQQQSSDFELKIEIAPNINFACHQNSIPFIENISILNSSSSMFENLELKMEASPNFIKPRTWHLEKLLSGQEIEIPKEKLDLELEGDFLFNLKESIKGNISFLLYQEDNTHVAAKSLKTTALARNEWGGYGFYPEILAAFSMPNDEAVDKLLHQATKILQDSGKTKTIKGYEDANRKDVWLYASAIWSALQTWESSYSYPPKSFECTGQKIRSPSTIFETQRATCLDTSMLFCAALEQANLNPIVILKKDHAFVGLWMIDESFSDVVNKDVVDLRKRIDLNDILVFETTFITNRPPLPFKKAIEEGKQHTEEEGEFVVAIDIKQARNKRVTPLDFAKSDLRTREEPRKQEENISLDDAPDDLEDISKIEIPEASKSPKDRLEKWQQKLLDLTLRNPLINFRSTTRNITSIVCPSPAKLEDIIASGKTINIQPLPVDIIEQRQDIHKAKTGAFLEKEVALKGLDKNQPVMYVREDKDTLQKRLIGLFRAANHDLKEGGVNTLFLALGFLVWKREKDKKKCRAPLILLPVELKRASVVSRPQMVSNGENTSFNKTLLEMLKRDFSVPIPGLDKELPADDSGVDLGKIWNIVRLGVKDIEGFEVKEDIALGRFFFSKYLMWKELVDRTDDLKKNPVVRLLLEGKSDVYKQNLAFPKEKSLDESYSPKNIFTPLSADSSQLSCIIAAQEGKDFIIIGPPGTGKSQTICNIITHLIGHGKTILFLAEKVAALNMVYKRLKDNKLGHFCLEIHSNKANKKHVLNQLESASLREEDCTLRNGWQIKTSSLQEYRDKLGQHLKSLHTKHKNGMTIYEAMGKALQKNSHIDLSFSSVDQHTEEDIQELRQIVGELKTLAENNKEYYEKGSYHPFDFIKKEEWSEKWKQEICDLADDLKSHAEKFHKDIKEVLGHFDWGDKLLSFQQSNELVNLANILLNLERTEPDFVLGPCGYQDYENLEKGRDLLEQYCSKTRDLSVLYKPHAWQSIQVEEWWQKWKAAQDFWWLKTWFWRHKTKKVLKSLTTPSAKRKKLNPEQDLKIFRDLEKYGKKIREIGENLSHLPIWAGFETDMEHLGNTLVIANKLQIVVNNLYGDRVILQKFKQRLQEFVKKHKEFLREDVSFGRALKCVIESQKHYKENFESLSRLTDNSKLFSSNEDTLGTVIDGCEAILGSSGELRKWCLWQTAYKKAKNKELKPLLDVLEKGNVQPKDLEKAFEVGYSNWWVRKKIDQDDVLKTFDSDLHEEKIRQFRKLDEDVRELTPEHLKQQSKIPEEGDGNLKKEKAILNRLFQQRRPRMAVRRLMDECPNELRRLTPCFLMSPLSVVQYLPADMETFDVVIFDEASQITPWDAIGSISRGRQTIVVGDNKQMPPTNLFNRADAESEDESEDDEGDLESILEEMIAAGVPKKTLSCHYRSKHESLIIFSNKKYYEGELITFPSPEIKGDAVKLVFVENAIYENQKNRKEANTIVAEVMRRLEDPEQTKSIGIVTFNKKQQDLIEELLEHEIEKKRHSFPNIMQYFSNEKVEPVFVKNLESVQGDERDVILLSVTRAPDNRTGKVHMQFGPLNQDGGHKRLNVAITRAREEMLVFSSIKSGDIDLSRIQAQARGVKDLKYFLEYAECGREVLGLRPPESVGDYENDFEKAVSRGLENRGWTVHPQIGVSRYRIDIGIINPNNNNDYLVGIECDGASYHSSATARDRDKIREEVLRRLGWDLLRVWSTDFFHNPEGELDKLHTKIEEIRLHRATGNGHKEVVEVPVEKGADVKAKNNYGATRLHEAAYKGHNKEVVEVLVEKGADVNAKTNYVWTPLHRAANNGHKEEVAFLVEKGADVNAQDEVGETPLHRAASWGHKEEVAFLVEKGADVNAKNNYGWTPLHLASSNGYKEMVAFLVEKGANVKAKTKDGDTPLHWATAKGYKEVVAYLISKGAL